MPTPAQPGSKHLPNLGPNTERIFLVPTSLASLNPHGVWGTSTPAATPRRKTTAGVKQTTGLLGATRTPVAVVATDAKDDGTLLPHRVVVPATREGVACVRMYTPC